MFHKPDLHGKRSDSVWHYPVNSTFIKWTLEQHATMSPPCPLQVSMTVKASSTASSASWLCSLPAVKAAASPFWKTTSQLSTLSGTRSASYVGWVSVPLWGLKDVSINNVCCVLQNICSVRSAVKWSGVWFPVCYGCSFYRRGWTTFIFILIQGSLPCMASCDM